MLKGIIATATLATVATVGATIPAGASSQGLTLARHGVVASSTLPSCTVEDASSGPVPCSWNFGTSDGNGQGLAYYVTRDGKTHYVWAHTPRRRMAHGYRWVTSGLADALAESAAGNRRWKWCLVRVAGTTRVVCPDGAVFTS